MVRAAYDAVAEKWGREREANEDAREVAWIDRFCSSLTGTRVLELGCGGGAILARVARRGLRLTGIDFSRAQLERARLACPSARLIQGDLAEIALAPAGFDGAIVYDCLWHLPREQHGAILSRLRGWLVDRAPLLLSVASLDPGDPDELLQAQLCGVPIYYSGWPRETTFALLRDARFELIAFDDTPERALLLIARAV